MGDRLNIRNAKVVALVKEQTALRGMNITELIDLALDKLPPVEKVPISKADDSG